MVLYDREYSYKKNDRQRASPSQAMAGARLLRRHSQERHPVALSQDPRQPEGVCLTSNTIRVIRHTGVRTELCYHLRSLHSPGSSGTWAAIDNSRQPLNHSSHESHLACLPPSVLVVPTPIQRNKSITSQWITKLLRSSRMAYMANWNLLWEKIVLRKIADRVVGI